MKRIIALILTMCTILGSVLSLGGCSNEKIETWSKAQWITALAENFGMNTYASEKAYYKDVNADAEYFKYVQSCEEWGVISSAENDKFDPTAIASMEFALETALTAAEVDLEGKTAVEYAVAQGIIADDSYMSVREKMTPARAEFILAWVSDLYINKPVEMIEHVDLVEDIKNYTQEENKIAGVSETEYVISADLVSGMNVGDIFIAPGDEMNPTGIACKVEEVRQNEDGSFTVITSQPEVDEIFDEINIATLIVPTEESMILSDGVEIIEEKTSSGLASGNYFAERLDGRSNNGNQIVSTAKEPKGTDFSFSVNFTKGTVGLDTSWKDLLGAGESISIGGEYPYKEQSDKSSFEKTSIIPDRNLFGKDPYDNQAAIDSYKRGDITVDELIKELNLRKDQTEKMVPSMTNKFSGGYELVGELKLKDFYVLPEFELKKVLGIPTGIKKVGVTVNYDIEASLTLKGELKEELTVARFPIPVGPTGVTVDVVVKVAAELNGEVSVKVEVENQAKAMYENGKMKNSATQAANLSAEASGTLQFGPQFGVEIRAYGLYLIDASLAADVKFTVGASAKFSTGYEMDDETITVKRSTTFKFEVDGYVPIVTLKLGANKKSLAHKIGLKFSIPLIGESKAYHFDVYEAEAVIWQQEMTMPLVETVEETEETETQGTETEELETQEFEDINRDDESGGFDMEETPDSISDGWGQEYLGIERYYVFLDQGEVYVLETTSIPKGYSAEELLWSSSNSAVVSVSGGILTAGEEGVAEVTVSTKDGKYTAKCAVSVAGEAIEYEPLEEIEIYDL